MNLYKITWDGEPRYVEGETFGTAVRTWIQDRVRQWKEDGDYEPGDEDREPESVELVSEEPVVRAGCLSTFERPKDDTFFVTGCECVSCALARASLEALAASKVEVKLETIPSDPYEALEHVVRTEVARQREKGVPLQSIKEWLADVVRHL